MSKLTLTFLFAIVASLSGCAGVVSLHPLVTPNDKDAVFEPALVGTWEAVGGKQADRVTIARRDPGYEVTSSDKLKFSMCLLKTRGRYLLDVYFPSDEPQVPAHLFFKLRFEKDTAWIAEMDSAWFKEQIETRGQLRYERLADDHNRMVLTASTAELRRYLLPYLLDDRAFEKETEVRRVPEGAHNGNPGRNGG